MQYRVRALGPEGVVSLTIEAADGDEAMRRVVQRGYAVLGVVASRTRGGRRERFALLLFTQELVALLNAGLGLIEALQALAEKQSAAAGKHVIDGVLEVLRDGRPLSAALAGQPAVFPALYVAAVRASERTGDLGEALGRFAAYRGQLEQLQSKLVSALLYPVLLLGIGALVVLFLLGYVVPSFSHIYADLDRELPLASRALFEAGRLIAENAWATATLAVLCVALIVVALRTHAVRAAAVRLAWKVPGAGERLRTFQLARFYRTVSMLVRGGVPLVSALDMSAGLLDDVLRKGLIGAARDVREGSPASRAFERNGLATPIALRMMVVGERSGDLGALMERAASFHDDELARWVERFTRLFEPLLMLLIGLVIGGIVVMMYMPIFELAGNLQ
jgi:general secretion pathway protein F